MKERDDKITMSHHEFKQLMREYSCMARETNNKRLSAKCASLCMDQVITSVTSGDSKKLCYPRDGDYISIAKGCIE